METDFIRKVEEIIKVDPRYKVDAYEFVMRALYYTQRKLKKKGHVVGKDLLEGMRRLCLEEFGPMARTVIEHWGIKTTEDVGNIVFNMINKGVMSKTEEDSIDDFKNIFDFKKAFDKTYKVQLERQLRKTKNL
ncbi:Minf_1886 family protein [Candidatus Omnitrophota bacterium]